MVHTTTLIVGLLLLWFLSSGYLIPLILGLGAASIALVVWLAYRMDVIDHESHPVHMAPKGVLFFPWLAWEVVKSNIDIAAAILKGDAAISPATLKIKASQQSDVGRVTYANSITLTPGTVTLYVDGDDFLVHALTEASAAGLQSGEMDRRTSDFEGRVKRGTEGIG